MLNSIHSQPIPTIDDRGPSLGFLDKVSEKVRLCVVQPFDTPFRNNTAVVCLDECVREPMISKLHCRYSHP